MKQGVSRSFLFRFATNYISINNAIVENIGDPSKYHRASHTGTESKYFNLHV